MTTTEQWRVPHPQCDQVSVADLIVGVRPAYRCSRWAWHLVDGLDGREFESGFDYDSPSAARSAGFSRLAELTSAVPDVTTGVVELFPSARPGLRYLNASRLRAA